MELREIGNVYGTRPGRDRSLPGSSPREEGVRFGTDMLGSAVTAGRIPLDHAHELADGDADERRPVPHAYLECHTPRGYSNPTACGNGVDVLANAVRRLADQA